MLEMRDITIGYGVPVLSSVDFSVSEGERVGVLGMNGSGKSTLLRCACTLAEPMRGSLRVDGKPVVSRADRIRMRERIGYVGQDPDDQMVASLVFDEVAFGPCNLGWDPDRIHAAVQRALNLCDLQDLENRDVSSLSGGQRQRVAIAGALAMEPKYLLLDEPCTMLDAPSRRRVAHAVERANEMGAAVVQVTHELEEVMGYDRLVVLGGGSVAWQGSPIDFLLDDEAVEASGCLVSGWLALARNLIETGVLSSDSDLSDPRACAAQAFAQGFVRGPVRSPLSLRRLDSASQLPKVGPGADLAAHNVTFSYASGGARQVREAAVRDVNVVLSPGRVTLMVGVIGSGKSTVAKLLSGLLCPDKGRVMLAGKPVKAGRVGYAFQSADDQLFADSVLADVAFGPKNMGLSDSEAMERARCALRRVGMDPDVYGTCNPFALSGGQRRRVALAGVFALESPYVVLDEPTVGLDAPGIADLSRVVSGLTKEGVGVLVVSHDVDRLLPLADDVVVIDGGKVVWSGPKSGLPERSARLRGCGVGASALDAFWDELSRLWGVGGGDGPNGAR